MLADQLGDAWSPPPPPRAAAAAASAAARRPASDRSAVWAKPVVSPTTTRMPAPRSRPEVSSSTLPSSSRADDDRLSSTKTSAKSPPVSQRGAEDPGDDGLFDHGWASCGAGVGLVTGDGAAPLPARVASTCALAAPARSAYRNPVPVKPGLSASVELVVSDADTAVAMRSGSVPVLATPRLIALAEEASVAALDGHLAVGETSVGTKVQIDHLAAHRRGQDGAGRGQRREGQRAPGDLHGVGQRRPGTGGGRPGHPGRGRRGAVPRQGPLTRRHRRAEAANDRRRTRSTQRRSGASSDPVPSGSAVGSSGATTSATTGILSAAARRHTTAGEAWRRPDSMFDRWGWLIPAWLARTEIDRPERCRMTLSACRLTMPVANQFYQ